VKIDWEYRDGRQLLSALCFGIATLGLFFITLAFSPFLGQSDDVHSATPTASAEASPYDIFRSAAAAPISTVPASAPGPTSMDGDSRLDNYQLERDACCVGN
jgi:hypothetical protein